MVLPELVHAANIKVFSFRGWGWTASDDHFDCHLHDRYYRQVDWEIRYKSKHCYWVDGPWRFDAHVLK